MAAMPVMNEPPLPIERYAEISAAIDAGMPRDQAVAAAGLAVEQWLLIQQYWLSRFGAEASVRVFESAKIFQRIYLKQRTALAARGMGRVPTRAPVSAPTSGPVSSGERPLPPREVAAPLQQGLGAHAAQEGPRLTLPQYASICVELAMYPKQTEEVRQRYGFDEAALERENREWQWRFDRDRSLFDRYLHLFKQYRDWLLGAGAQQQGK
jgi:hypothetical protein